MCNAKNHRTKNDVAEVAEVAEMAENRDDKIVYATYAIYASANFNIRHGMPGNGRRKELAIKY